MTEPTTACRACIDTGLTSAVDCDDPRHGVIPPATDNPMLTEDEFARQYAERSGVTVAWLTEHGITPAPCDCGDGICQGWRMDRR